MSEEVKKTAGLFDVEDDSTMAFLNPKTRNSDGIYRPSLEDAKDKRAGYKVTLRFLMNLKKDGTFGESAIEKHIHYVKLQNQPELAGYYDCKKNLEKDCPLCTTYWTLSKSKNAADQEKSELLNRNTKYYSYVYIINDEEHPEHNGKIMVYSYGYKIREKINDQWKGNVDGKKCNVFNLANGKDFRLIIKENKTPEGTFPNYDSSQFLEKEPIKINGKAIPVEYSEEHKKNIITNAKVQKFLQEFLLKREHDLEEYEAKAWDDETSDKVNRLISVITGEETFTASRSVEKAGVRESSKQPAASTATASTDDDFNFGGDTDDKSVDDFFNVGEE